MFKIFFIMVAGGAFGWLLRDKELIGVGRLIEIAIYALLLFLGIMVGSNPDVMDNLGTIGVDALIIAGGATFGSVLAACALYHFVFKGGEHN